ncbi:hypothetical protein [Roseovarius dicentrarchi]|uniref:hypothetical protein n=1 Tax=Roseovarius dicentrarchi TaxID=2250573 RepID=UPI0013966775|nr:hypothetical protein [Roseovarius dicentrarchi]
MSTKGLAGSVRVNSLDQESTSAMESHELRLDYSGQLRSIEPQNEALFYRPYGNDLSISESYKKHVEGARRNTSASKLLRHAFVQFPTSIEITPQTQEMMLREAVAFINKTHGGRAVFHARIDRDERGKHGVDVFFAPRYEKRTAKDVTDWISLTKFGKEGARERLGQKQEEKYNKKTKEWEPQFKTDGSPKMVWQDSAHFQGQVLQDEWFEHLRDVVGLDWVLRGEKKVGRDPDRLEPEEYKLKQEREKLAQDKLRFEAEKAEEAARLSETVEWVERSVKNLSASIDRVQDGTYDTALSPADMPDQPKRFEVLKEAAPDKRPTLGFRARFWGLNFADGRGPAPLPAKIRAALTKAFDRVASWASELREARQEAERASRAATEAATAFLEATEEEAAQILTDAHEEGDRLASVDVRLQTYATRHEVLLDAMKSNLNPDDFERAMTSARKNWAADPRNPDAEKPTSNSPALGS